MIWKCKHSRCRSRLTTGLAIMTAYILVTLYRQLYIKNLCKIDGSGRPSYDITMHDRTALGGLSNADCREVHHIAFIKVHKCGSSAIENINLRFGLSRNLTFMLPEGMYMIEHTLYRPWKKYLPPPKGRHFDILTNHAVYNKLELERLMPNDTVYTAILRHPFTTMRSAVHYFKIIENVPGRNISVFLANPNDYFDEMLIQMAINSTSYEMGIDPRVYTSETDIKAYLNHIRDDFLIVIILERLDESLVLMKRYLCWKLKDILVRKKNSNSENIHMPITEADLKRHREIAPADYLVYEFFHKKLDDQIRNEGRDFHKEVEWYNVINNRVVKFCNKQIYSKFTSVPTEIQVEQSKWNDIFSVSVSDCILMAENALHFMNRTKLYQYGRTDVTKDDITSN